jgi:predicted HicB family RNase H-like nuclease
MTKIEIRGSLNLGPYRGYNGLAEYDPDDGSFYGKVVDTRDVITFVGDDISELMTAFQDSIDD